MTTDSRVKEAARQYMAEHNVNYTVALRRVKDLQVGDRVREIPGNGTDIRKMPIGEVDFIYIDEYDIRYPDGKMSERMQRSDLEAVET